MEVAILLIAIAGTAGYFLFKQIKREGGPIWLIILLILIYLLLIPK